MKRSKETWIIRKVKYYWAFCSKTTQGLSAILKNIYPAHEHQRFHDAFDVISLSQSAVFPPCPYAHQSAGGGAKRQYICEALLNLLFRDITPSIAYFAKRPSDFFSCWEKGSVFLLSAFSLNISQKRKLPAHTNTKNAIPRTRFKSLLPLCISF